MLANAAPHLSTGKEEIKDQDVWTNCHMTSEFGETWQVICSEIFTLQIMDMKDLHGIKITDELHDCYRLPEDPGSEQNQCPSLQPQLHCVHC